MIRHVWFDFSETLVFLKKERHDRLRYETFGEVTNKTVDQSLKNDYESLYEQYHHSNAAIFTSLGRPAKFWSERVNTVNPAELYELADPDIPNIMLALRAFLPISIFSNINLVTILPDLGLQPSWFSNLLSAEMVSEPKPALAGFQKIVELSHLPPNEILYIGDDLKKDVVPAQQVGLQAGLLWKQSPTANYNFKSFQEILGLIQHQAA